MNRSYTSLGVLFNEWPQPEWMLLNHFKPIPHLFNRPTVFLPAV